MRHEHAATAVILVISATVHCYISATRNIHSLINESNFPEGIVREARFEALSISFDSNC